MIAFYGHDDALFLSLQMKRLGIRSVEILIKKYSELLFGTENGISARDMRNAFKKCVFTQNKNLFMTSEYTGNAASTLLRSYAPYLDVYECEKGKDFDPYKHKTNTIQEGEIEGFYIPEELMKKVNAEVPF